MVNPLKSCLRLNKVLKFPVYVTGIYFYITKITCQAKQDLLIQSARTRIYVNSRKGATIDYMFRPFFYKALSGLA